MTLQTVIDSQTAKRRRPGRRQRNTTAAFTLVELLLSVSLILLLATAVIVNFSMLNRGARLTEGATMVESLLRYARAQAASTGRQVKVVFDHGLTTVASPGGALPSTNTAPGVQVLWERDPLGAPGKFETLQGASMLVDQVNELVRVCEVRAPGMDAFASAANSPDSFALQFGIASTNAPTLGDASSQPVTPPITCYPDGSSDSVEIVLSPLGDDDLRRSVVTLSGVTGSMKHRMMTVTDDGTEAPDTDTAPPPVPASGAAPDR